MAQLAQAYLHLKPYFASRRKLQALGKFADAVASDAAKRIYAGGVVVDVELEEGSLIARVTVVGLLAGHLALETYSKIADYKGFKDSVAELCDDAQSFAVDVCEPFRKKAGASPEQVFRFERRLKTPGKLNRIAKRLHRLEESVDRLSPKDLQKELSEVNRALSRVMQDLAPVDAQLVEKALTVRKLPPPSKWPVPEAELPKIARREEEQLALSQEAGSTPSAILPSDHHRLIYRNRVRVDEQFPKLDQSRRSAGSLPLRASDDEL